MNGIARNTIRSLRFLPVAAALAVLGSTAAHMKVADRVAAPAPTRIASVTPVAQAAVRPAAHSEGRRHWYQFGRASWYGSDFQGQQTASGEPYNMNAFTCAHRSLPLGALVRVTNLGNHRSVIVRVNDRGPAPQSRVVDLSWRAARMLGFSNKGTARVRLDLLDPKPTRAELAQLVYPELQ